MNYREKIGTKDNLLALKTPPLSSEYSMHVDEKNGEDILVCTVGKTILHYQLRCLEDAQKMLQEHGDWMEMGSKNEKVATKEGTFEDWGRSSSNPVGGWNG